MSVANGFRLRALVRSVPGAGKSHFAATCPKSYFIISPPGEEDTWMVRPQLKSNVVKAVILAPTSDADTKRTFAELDAAIAEANGWAKEGKVETLIIDNMTNLTEMRWIYINQFQKILNKQGEVDTRSMYGSLNRWCRGFVNMSLLSFPGHLVVTCHEQMEEEEKMDRLPDKSSPIVPAILGGFRDDIGSYFSMDLSLEKKVLGATHQFIARTNKGNQRNSKSRYPLPPIIENISYQSLVSAVQQSLGTGTPA